MLRITENRRILKFCSLFALVSVSSALWSSDRNWGVSRPVSYSCGLSYVSRILGGKNAVPNEFPWMVALMRSVSGKREKQFYCGGTIISKRYILTAAHCISTSLVNRITDIVARVGAHKLQRGLYNQDFPIRNGARHPRYTKTPLRNDIAILQTYDKFSWNAGVGPICLPFKNRSNIFEYSIVTLVGWGATGHSSHNSKILKKAQTRVQTNSWCNKYTQNLMESSELCTYEANKDSCSSDSGGPVISTGRRKFLIGIISSGGVCGFSVGINTRITSYLPWIKATINRMDYALGLPLTEFEEYSM